MTGRLKDLILRSSLDTASNDPREETAPRPPKESETSHPSDSK